jgi:Flp pilus assembly protein CpaB
LNPRTRTGIIFAILGILIIVGGVFVLLSFIRQTLAPLPAPTPVPMITEKVIVTTHDIALGALLRPDDLTEVDVPVELIPRNALRNEEGAIGRFTTIPLVTGEIVLTHHLAAPTNINHDLAFILGDEQVLMAFPANDLMSRLNVIQRGDIVDILVTIQETVTVPADSPGEEDTEESRQFTFDALQLIEVTAMVVEIVTEGRPSQGLGVEDQLAEPTPQPSEVNVEAYLLALSPQDALVIKNLRDSGAIFDLVLRSPTSVQLFDLEPVSSEYLIDRYELEILP